MLREVLKKAMKPYTQWESERERFEMVSWFFWNERFCNESFFYAKPAAQNYKCYWGSVGPAKTQNTGNGQLSKLPVTIAGRIRHVQLAWRRGYWIRKFNLSRRIFVLSPDQNRPRGFAFWWWERGPMGSNHIYSWNGLSFQTRMWSFRPPPNIIIFNYFNYC